MLSSPGAEIQLLFCYAHADKGLRDQLELHMADLKRRYNLNSWHDGTIPPGDEWKKAIDRYLDTANIILLLISPDFLASDSCYREMQRALERYQSKRCLIAPILLRPTHWEPLSFADLEMLPTGGQPITTWSNQDEAFLDVIKGISQIIKKFLNLYIFNEESSKSEVSTDNLFSDEIPTKLDRNTGSANGDHQLNYHNNEKQIKILPPTGIPWQPNFSVPHYVNVPRISLNLATIDALNDEEIRLLRDISIFHDSSALMNTIVLLKKFIKSWKPGALDLADPKTLATENIGARIQFNNSFRTKDIPWRDEVEAFVPQKDKPPHIYCKIHGKKVRFYIDPHWIITDSAFVDFTSGQATFAGIGILKHVEKQTARITPLVIGAPLSSLDMAMYDSGLGLTIEDVLGIPRV